MYKIENFKASSNFAEIFQENSIKFAYAKPTNRNSVEQLHGFVDCRDFLGDVLWLEETERASCVYHFCWNPEKKKIARDKTYLLVKMKASFYNELMKNIHWLNNYEVAHKLRKTTIHKTDKKDVYLFVASSFWLKRIWLISLYTFTIKGLALDINPEYWTGNEKQYYNDVKSKWIPMWNNLKTLYKATKGSVTHELVEHVHDTHYQSGFVHLCSNPSFSKYHSKFNKVLQS